MVNFPIHHYSKDQIIFEEGTIANVAYIVKEGSIEISVGGKNGKLVLAILKPGDIFGEMALILKDNKRTATAIALADSEVIAIYKKYFFEYLHDSPAVINTLICGMVTRLHETTTRLQKVPNHFRLQIEDILYLLTSHGVETIKYTEIIKTLSHCFQVEIPYIEEQLTELEKLGHIQISIDERHKRVITLPYKKISE